MSKLDPSDPESFMKNSKKGRTLMMFATVSGIYYLKYAFDIVYF